VAAPTLGIDVGGTKIAAGVVAPDGTILARDQVPTDSEDSGAIVTAIVKVARQLQASAPVDAAGVGAAGLVDVDRGVILGAPNLSYRDLPLGPMLRERLALPVVVDNDANAAAWGEAMHGAGRGIRDQIMVTVGTGIGGGLVLGGRLYHGAHGVGAEIGHMVVDPDGPLCGCGNRGCWEAVASGGAIGRMARERLEAAPAPTTVLDRTGGDVGAVTGAVVGAAAVAGDAFARSVVEEAGRMLGLGMASLVNIFDPELIVVGGGAVAGLGELILGPARRAMGERIVGREWRPPVRIAEAALGNDAGIVGSAALARERA
jgi:glucokinase